MFLPFTDFSPVFYIFFFYCNSCPCFPFLEGTLLSKYATIFGAFLDWLKINSGCTHSLLSRVCVTRARRAEHNGNTAGEGVLGYVQEMLPMAPHARVRTQGPALAVLEAIRCSGKKFFFYLATKFIKLKANIHKRVFSLSSKINEGC